MKSKIEKQKRRGKNPRQIFTSRKISKSVGAENQHQEMMCMMVMVKKWLRHDGFGFYHILKTAQKSAGHIPFRNGGLQIRRAQKYKLAQKINLPK